MSEEQITVLLFDIDKIKILLGIIAILAVFRTVKDVIRK